MFQTVQRVFCVALGNGYFLAQNFFAIALSGIITMPYIKQDGTAEKRILAEFPKIKTAEALYPVRTAVWMELTTKNYLLFLSVPMARSKESEISSSTAADPIRILADAL